MSHRFAFKLRQCLPGFELNVAHEWDERAIAIFGPSGSGKTTMLESLAGVRQAQEAYIRLDGLILEDSENSVRLPPERRRIGWVPQDASLFPHLDVRGNLDFGIARSTGTADRDRAVEILEIGPFLDRFPGQLSGGERQRVALARALASGPSVLLLDEPLASLDLGLRARIFPYLIRLRDSLDLPMIYVTHDAGEALALAQRVLILEDGRIVASGEATDLLRSPAALRLLDMVHLENRLVVTDTETIENGDLVRVSLADGLTLLAPSGFAALPGELLGVRAEDILIASRRVEGLSAQNLLSGEVVKRTEQAGRCLVSVRIGRAILRAATTAHAASQLELASGMQVTLVFKAAAIHRLGETETGRRVSP